jgi:hypothetical protein
MLEGFAELTDGATKVRSKTANTTHTEDQDYDYQDNDQFRGTKMKGHYSSKMKLFILRRLVDNSPIATAGSVCNN